MCLLFNCKNRLYWSEGVLIKICLSNGLDIQTHSLAIEAADALSYKVP